MCWGVVGIESGAFPDRSARQTSRAAWRQSQCVSSGGGISRAVSALSGSVSSSSSLSSLGTSRPCATGPITPDTRKSKHKFSRIIRITALILGPIISKQRSLPSALPSSRTIASGGGRPQAATSDSVFARFSKQ